MKENDNHKIVQSNIENLTNIINRNAENQEKLIIKFSSLIIASVLTYTRFLYESEISIITIIGISGLCITVVFPILSYAIGLSITRTYLKNYSELMKTKLDSDPDDISFDDKELIPYNKYKRETIRRFLDYTTSIIFSIAFPAVILGIICQYQNFARNNRPLNYKEKDMTQKSNTRSLETSLIISTPKGNQPNEEESPKDSAPKEESQE